MVAETASTTTQQNSIGVTVERGRRRFATPHRAFCRRSRQIEIRAPLQERVLPTAPSFCRAREAAERQRVCQRPQRRVRLAIAPEMAAPRRRPLRCWRTQAKVYAFVCARRRRRPLARMQRILVYAMLMLFSCLLKRVTLFCHCFTVTPAVYVLPTRLCTDTHT